MAKLLVSTKKWLIKDLIELRKTYTRLRNSIGWKKRNIQQKLV